MNCESFHTYLQDCVENHRKPSLEPYREHLESCVSCRQEWDHWQVLDRAISDWKDIGESPDLASRILLDLSDGDLHDESLNKHHGSLSPVRSVGERTIRKSRRPVSSKVIRLLTAGAVLAMVVPLVLGFFLRPPVENEQTIATGPEGRGKIVKVKTKQRDAGETSTTVSWDRLVGVTTTAYGTLIRETGLSPKSLLPAMDSQQEDDNKEDDEQEQPIRSVLPAGRRLGQLDRRVRESVGFMRQLLPGIE